MANFYDDNEDLQFYVEKAIDWESLYELTEFSEEKELATVEEAKEFYREIFQLVGELAANEVAPRADGLDRFHLDKKDGEVVEPQEMLDITGLAKEMGLHGLPLPREFGGMNAPMMVYMINGELFSRADVGVMTHMSFHAGIALALLIYSVHEGSAKIDLKSKKILGTPYWDQIEEIARGDAWGSMNITEPNAGSDMAAISSKAVKDKQGNWTLSGEKIFITSGHGKHHIVIARTEDPKKKPGLEGLSLFLVEAYTEDAGGNRVRDKVTLGKVEEKIGHHSSPTCSVNFDDAPATLIGKRGEGFKLMLMLMNNARIGVGFEGLGICEAAYRLARDYAAERPSMGKTIDQHEMIADMLDEMRTEIQAIRALCITCTYHEELAQRSKILRMLYKNDKKKLAEIDAEIKLMTNRSRMFTPLLKYYSSEAAVKFGRYAIQILGGAGYTKEYEAEKLLRDALVLPIYEGTSQIQSLMAMKDNLLGIMRNPAEFGRNYAKAVSESISARDPRARQVALIRRRTYAALRHLMTKIFGGKLKMTVAQPFAKWRDSFSDWDPKRDFGPAMLHAERLTKMLSDLAICEILLDQAQKFEEREDLFDRFIERALSRSHQMHYEITNTGDRLLSALKGESAEDDGDAKAAA